MPCHIDIENLSVKDIMDRWPETMRVFLDNRLHCVGCPMSPFQTLTDAAREHGRDEAELLSALERVIAITRAPAPLHPQSAAAGVDS